MSSSVSESGPSAASSSSSNTKKPFDKKKWRENKYSFKAKTDRWQERRERGLQHRYNKMLKKSFGKQVKGGKNPNLEPLGSKGQEDGDGEQERPQGGNSQRRFGQKNKKREEFAASRRQRQEQDREQAQQARRAKAEERRRKEQERQEAIKKYKQKKADKFKVLSKKTKRGQPVMAGRMEMLLQKIQSDLS